MTGANSGLRLHASPTLQAGAMHAAGTGPLGTAGSKKPDCVPSPWPLPVSPGSPLLGRDEDPSQALLLWLLRYPLLRAEDLAAITGYSRQRTYAQLAQLEAAGTIEAIRVPALGHQGGHLYHVSAVGMQALAHTYGDTVWRAARAWGADEAGLQRLLPRAPGLVAVQTVVMALITGIGSASAPYVREVPQKRAVRTEWAWERDYRFLLTGRLAPDDAGADATTRNMRIDAYVRLRVWPSPGATSPSEAVSAAGRTENETSYGLFVLCDTGFLDVGGPRAALRALLRGRQGLEADGGTMPALLLLVPDAHDAQRWQALNARTALERWLARPLDGGILVVPPPWQNGDRASQQTHSASERSRSGIDASNIWQVNWLSLSDSGSRRLAALLTPAPEPSLPALSMVAPRYDPDAPSPRRAAKVIGHFNDRADRWAESMPWRGELGRSATEGGDGSGCGQVPRSGRELLALLALRLDARHDALLALLAAHPLLSGEELAAVVGITPASVDVYTRHLNRLGLVVPATNLTLAGAPPVPPNSRWLRGRYALTALGTHLLSARSARTIKGAPPEDGRGWPREDRPTDAYHREVAALMRVPAHTAGVYQFIASLYGSASSAQTGEQAQRVAWWETGRPCARQYREIDGWHALRPDAAGEYLAGTQRLRFWLEWDRGTMRRRDLEAKFAAYAHYVRSREWRADGNTPLPTLLIVTGETGESGQESRVAQALRDTLPESVALRVYVTQASLLVTEGPLAPIWRTWPRQQRISEPLVSPFSGHS